MPKGGVTSTPGVMEEAPPWTTKPVLKTTEAKKANRYSAIINQVFKNHYKDGIASFEFSRVELARIAADLGIELGKHLADQNQRLH